MNWAVTLILNKDEEVESRLKRIVEFILSTESFQELQLTEIDATGPVGNKFTKVLNQQEKLGVSAEELLELLSEDGQVLELDGVLKTNKQMYRIIIRRGSDIDVIGDGKRLNSQIIGRNKSIDASMYN